MQLRNPSEGKWYAMGYELDLVVERDGDYVSFNDKETQLRGRFDRKGIATGEVINNGVSGGSFVLTPVLTAHPAPVEPGYTQAVGLTEAAVGGPPPQPTGRKRALLIGCNYPGSQAELRGCVNDVMRMSAMLRGRYGYSPHDMRILTDDGHGPHGAPTRANIISGMRWLVEGAQPGDALFFHYSGHGGQQPDPNYMEEDGYDETILPTDFEYAGMIVDDEIFDTTCAPLQSGVKLTGVMDCCHSGTGLDLPFVWQGGKWIEEDNPCHSAGDVCMISGCMDEQTSADATGNRGEAAGAMTTALCDVLDDLSGSSIGYTQLLEQMRVKLAQRGFDQIPNLTSSQRFDVTHRTFSPNEGFEPNGNPSLGRHFRKKKHPKVDYGEAFQQFLGMAGQGAMMFGLMQGAGQMFGGFGGGAPAVAAPAAVQEAPHDSSYQDTSQQQSTSLFGWGSGGNDDDDDEDDNGGGGFGFGDGGDDDDWDD